MEPNEHKPVNRTREMVSKLYKTDDGQPLILTDGQCELFDLIFKRKYPRNHIEAATRFGKSLVVALAVLTRASLFPEKWAIVSQTNEKAAVIMEYVIGHIFDNPVSRHRFIRKPEETEESIRRYKRKDKINFDLGEKRIGTIYITTAENALGLGAGNVICFPADVLIKTNIGDVEIGRLVNDRMSVKVASFNHSESKIEYQPIIGYNKNRKDTLVEVDFGKRKLVCTENHPIFVEGKGYVPACELKNGDIVLSL